MSVTGLTGNRFPGTSQLSKFYIKRRFADKEIYEKYLGDIESLLNINKPDVKEYNIPEDKKALLDERVAELEEKLKTVSSLYAISDELNYKSAEKEIAELNKILDQYLADIKEEVSNLNYKSYDYYVKQRLIEKYQSNYKQITNILANNKKMIIYQGCLLILGHDGNLYGCGDNSKNFLGDNDLTYHKYMTKVTFPDGVWVKDFEYYGDKILCITNLGKIYCSHTTTEYGLDTDSDPDIYKYKSILGYSENGILFSGTAINVNKPALIYYGENSNYFIDATFEKPDYRVLDTEDEDEFISSLSEAKLGANSITLYPEVYDTYKIGFIGKNYKSHFGTDEVDEDEYGFVIVSPAVIAGNYTEDNQKKWAVRYIHDLSNTSVDSGASFIMDSEHNLYVCGNNKYGQLGIDSDDEVIPTWTLVEGFKKNVYAINHTNDKTFLVTMTGVYDYENHEEEKYRNEKDTILDSTLWIAGKNLPSDPMIGIPTFSQMKELLNTINSVNLGRFDDENLDISEENQALIDEMLNKFSVLYAKIHSDYNLYTNNLKKFIRVYLDEKPFNLISDENDRANELKESADLLYESLTTV